MNISLSSDEIALLVAVTVASAVEFVEAFTIVLAMSLTRGLRSAVAGTLVALVALAVVTVIAGATIVRWFPEALLQLVVGSLLLIFGLQWLRKAVQRSAGVMAIHDEEAIFAREAAAGREAATATTATGPMGIDSFGFVVSFKGVFLEGLEVVFIVLSFGLPAGNVPLAAAGAGIAGAFVLIVGTLIRKPLTAVPENTLKYGVGLLLSTFGTFWAIEGLNAFAAPGVELAWPAGDLALPLVLLGWLIVSRLLVIRLRATRGAAMTAGAMGD